MSRSIKPLALAVFTVLLWSSPVLAANVHLQLEGALLTLGGEWRQMDNIPWLFAFTRRQSAANRCFRN